MRSDSVNLAIRLDHPLVQHHNLRIDLIEKLAELFGKQSLQSQGDEPLPNRIGPGAHALDELADTAEPVNGIAQVSFMLGPVALAPNLRQLSFFP